MKISEDGDLMTHLTYCEKLIDQYEDKSRRNCHFFIKNSTIFISELGYQPAAERGKINSGFCQTEISQKRKSHHLLMVLKMCPS